MREPVEPGIGDIDLNKFAREENVRIFPGTDHSSFPQHYDYEKLGSDPEIQQIGKDLVRVCQEFLSSPVIIDSFKDSGRERIAWRNGLKGRGGEKIYLLVRSNKLAFTSIGKVVGYIASLADLLERGDADPGFFEEIHKLNQSLSDIDGSSYVEKSLDQKIATIRRVYIAARKILELFKKG